MRYEAHEYMVGPVRETSEPWRLVAGIVSAVFLYLVFSILIFWMAGIVMGTQWVQPFALPKMIMTPGQTLFALAGFTAMLAAICLVVILLHQRSPETLFGGFGPALRSFRDAMMPLVPLIFGFLILTYFTEDLTSNLNFVVWLVLLPLSVGFLLIQVTAEEVVFRGYLQSQIAATGAPMALWMAIPAILFGLGHYQEAVFGPLAPWFVLWAIAFGLLAADLTARTGNLGAAIAFHCANNFVALLLVGLKDHLGGLSLFSYPFMTSDTAQIAAHLPIDAVAMFILYLATRFGVRA